MWLKCNFFKRLNNRFRDDILFLFNFFFYYSLNINYFLEIIFYYNLRYIKGWYKIVILKIFRGKE